MVYRSVLTSVDHTRPIRLSTTGGQARTRSRPARSSTCQPTANNVQGLGFGVQDQVADDVSLGA